MAWKSMQASFALRFARLQFFPAVGTAYRYLPHLVVRLLMVKNSQASYGSAVIACSYFVKACPASSFWRSDFRDAKWTAICGAEASVNMSSATCALLVIFASAILV